MYYRKNEIVLITEYTDENNAYCLLLCQIPRYCSLFGTRYLE